MSLWVTLVELCDVSDISLGGYDYGDRFNYFGTRVTSSLRATILVTGPAELYVLITSYDDVTVGNGDTRTANDNDYEDNDKGGEAGDWFDAVESVNWIDYSIDGGKFHSLLSC